jgi:uncharacterized membrane protein
MEPQTHNEPVGNTTAPSAGEATSSAPTPAQDLSEHRTFAILGYILPFLFFIPLLDEKTKNVPYVRFHANQQLILLIIWAGVYLLSGSFYGFGLFYTLVQILNIALIVLMIIGAINAYKNEMKELPFVGQFKILK